MISLDSVWFVVASQAKVAGARMFDRLLLFFALLCLGATLAQAQPSPRRPMPEACQASSADALPELEKRRQTLERDIARQTTEVERVSKSKDGKAGGGGADARTKDLRESLRLRQEDLLEVLFRIECVRAAEPEAPSRSPFKRPQDIIEITTYYATNRKQNGRAPSPPKSTEVRSSSPRSNMVAPIVSIPPTHTPGNLEMPPLWKLERGSDASKHFVLQTVMPLDADAGRKEMAEKLSGMNSKALLVFVHGYNMGFAEAALRTAQMAHDLNFPGMAFFYSWPSANHVRSYWQDEEIARLSESVFEQLIDELSQLPVTDIYVVAHSMGNRIVGHALQARADKGKPDQEPEGVAAGGRRYQRRCLSHRHCTEAGRHAGHAHDRLRVIIRHCAQGVQDRARVQARRRDDWRGRHLSRHRDDRCQQRLGSAAGLRPFLRRRQPVGDQGHQVDHREEGARQAAWLERGRSVTQHLLAAAIAFATAGASSHVPREPQPSLIAPDHAGAALNVEFKALTACASLPISRKPGKNAQAAANSDDVNEVHRRLPVRSMRSRSGLLPRVIRAR